MKSFSHFRIRLLFFCSSSFLLPAAPCGFPSPPPVPLAQFGGQKSRPGEVVLRRSFLTPAFVHGLGGRSGAHARNQAVMDLGAAVCTPRVAGCPACPLRSVCEARAALSFQQLRPGKSFSLTGCRAEKFPYSFKIGRGDQKPALSQIFPHSIGSYHRTMSLCSDPQARGPATHRPSTGVGNQNVQNVL